MNLNLKDKVVMVSGASSGIGFATALAFAHEGARVAICARNENNIINAADKIQEETEADVLASTVDVTKSDDIDRWVKEVAEAFGGIHVCVTNAGGPPRGMFTDLTDQNWQAGVDLTLMSTIRLSRAVLPSMREQKWGRIIHLCSVSVRNPIPNLVISNSLRSAVVALSKSQADQLAADNILVNSVLTGWPHTEHVKHLMKQRAAEQKISAEEIFTQRSASIPLRRLAKPEEIAAPVVFLASQQASFITGTTITIDGGESRFPF